MEAPQRAKQRFLVLVWPAHPLPEDADWQGTDAYLRSLEQEYAAQSYRVLGGGYVLLIDIESHDTLRMVLDAIPLNKKRQVKLEVLPLLTVGP